VEETVSVKAVHNHSCSQTHFQWKWMR